MRLLPHDQDTGGFFVCVLEKAGQKTDAPPIPDPPHELPAVPPLDDVIVADESGCSSLKRAASPPTPSGPSESKRPKQETKKPKRDLGFREDPYSFVDPNHVEVASIS
jgi:multisite-specific tRNA:(cytosine-C5)-methyltransferase